MEIKNKTEQNVLQALEEELQLSALYQIFSKQAKAEGYLQISEIFKKTSRHELEHASILLELSHDCKIPSTEENLHFAVSEEMRGLYKAFAMQADVDGFRETATLFRSLAEIEESHGRCFEKILKDLHTNCVFEKNPDCIWICRVCGAKHRGKYAPQLCSVCGYPQSCFSVFREDY